MHSQSISQFYLHTPRHPLMEWTVPAFFFPAEAGPHLPTPEGWKAELTWQLYTLCVRWKHVCLMILSLRQPFVSGRWHSYVVFLGTAHKSSCLLRVILLVVRRRHRRPCSWHKDCVTEREGDGTEQRHSWEQGHVDAVSQTGRVYHRHHLPQGIGYAKVSSRKTIITFVVIKVNDINERWFSLCPLRDWLGRPALAVWHR